MIIDPPRGGYVPRFRSRDMAAKPAAVLNVAPAEATRTFADNGLRPCVSPFVVAGQPGDVVVDGESLSVKLCEASRRSTHQRGWRRPRVEAGASTTGSTELVEYRDGRRRCASA